MYGFLMALIVIKVILSISGLIALIIANKKCKQRRNIMCFNGVVENEEKNSIKKLYVAHSLLTIFNVLLYVMGGMFLVCLLVEVAYNFWIVYLVYTTIKKTKNTTACIAPTFVHGLLFISMCINLELFMVLAIIYFVGSAIGFIVIVAREKKHVQKDVAVDLFTDEEKE